MLQGSSGSSAAECSAAAEPWPPPSGWTLSIMCRDISVDADEWGADLPRLCFFNELSFFDTSGDTLTMDKREERNRLSASQCFCLLELDRAFYDGCEIKFSITCCFFPFEKIFSTFSLISHVPMLTRCQQNFFCSIFRFFLFRVFLDRYRVLYTCFFLFRQSSKAQQKSMRRHKMGKRKWKI